MKHLEITNRRVATTAREVLNDREIFYQYETDNATSTPIFVSFSSQWQDGKMLSGSYSQGGGFTLNGNGITQVEDLAIVNKVLATILEIIK